MLADSKAKFSRFCAGAETPDPAHAHPNPLLRANLKAVTCAKIASHHPFLASPDFDGNETMCCQMTHSTRRQWRGNSPSRHRHHQAPDAGHDSRTSICQAGGFTGGNIGGVGENERQIRPSTCANQTAFNRSAARINAWTAAFSYATAKCSRRQINGHARACWPLGQEL